MVPAGKETTSFTNRDKPVQRCFNLIAYSVSKHLHFSFQFEGTNKSRTDPITEIDDVQENPRGTWTQGPIRSTAFRVFKVWLISFNTSAGPACINCLT